MRLAWADVRRTRLARNVENWGVGLVPPPLHMSYRLVPISVTLYDLERRNVALILHYFTEFVYDVVVKQLLGLPRFQNLLLVYIISRLIPSAQLFSDYLSKTNSDNSV